MPGDEIRLVQLLKHLLGDRVGQRLAIDVRVVHPLEKSDGLGHGVEVLGRDVLGTDPELLKLADGGMDLFPDRSDLGQEPLVRGCHNEGIYLLEGQRSRARDLAPAALPFPAATPARCADWTP